MYHVLVAVDESESRAQTLADAVLELPEPAEYVEATVFHCFTENPEGASIQQLKSARLLAERLEEAGVEYRMVDASGDPVNELVDFADESDVDAIFLAGRKRSPAGKVLFGSVAQGVALSTDHPVMLCGGE